MKTIKLLLTTIAVLLCSVMANAYDFEVDGICYDITSFTDLTVKASSLSETFVGDLVIPSKVQFSGKELTVTEVGDDFAVSNESILSLTINEGVDSIGDRAFKNCTNIVTINIAKTVTKIGAECFYACTALDAFNNNGVISIGSKSFAECENMKEVSIENLVSLGERTFLNCKKLSVCYIPNITSIAKAAFQNCQALEEYNIPSSVKSIGESAFEGCSAISSIVIPNNVLELGHGAFNYCTSLTSISIGSGLTYLPWVFAGCTNLSNIRIEDATTTLRFGYTGERPFSSNYRDEYIRERRYNYYYSSAMFAGYNIKQLHIGRNITTESYLFKRYYQSGAYSLEDSYYVPNPPFSGANIEKLTIGSLVSDLKMCPLYKTSVPEIYASSWNGAFQGCVNLDSITLYSIATSIPENTFRGCSKISTLEIPNIVKEIGDNAFANCSGLKVLSLGSSLETIGDNALVGCDSLNEINIKSPNPPTYPTGFSSANYMNMQVNVPKGSLSIYQESEPWKNFWNLSESNGLFFEIDGVRYAQINDKNVEIVGNSISKLTELYIKSQVEYSSNNYNVVAISHYAFEGCSYLSSVQIENGIKAIGNSAFEMCTNLGSVDVAVNVSSIGAAAFKNCSSLKDVILPDSISTIPNECFYGCKSLDSILIPASVIEIGSYAFADCNKLNRLIIPQSVTTLGSYALNGCGSLRELVLEDSNIPLYMHSNSSYSNGSSRQKVEGQYLYFFVDYYTPYFSKLPIEKLYIGRNLSKESRYSISEKKYDSYGKYSYYVINSYDAPFGNLSKLKELIIGENVDILGPEQEYISEVGLYVTPGSFKNCLSIQTIDVKNPTPPTGAEFSDAVYSKAQLTVPAESKSLYKEAIGWKDFVSLMKYKITYIVDDSIYFADTLLVGDTIILPAEPVKEGYTFSGWSDVPATMPAEDIIVTGTFTINTYKITYIVDGEIYATDSVAYGTKIIAIEEPNKEGHTFNGWSEIPETMPANDITIVGAFKYAVTYMVNDEVYNTDSIVYGSEIVLIAEPTKEGYTFSGWSDIPEIMPAEDIVIDGYFSVNYYAINYIVDNEPFATDSVAYGDNIILRDEPQKEDYEFSGWSEAPETMPAHDIEVYGNFIFTSVTDVQVDPKQSQKVIEDNQLFIILSNGKKYNVIGKEM